MCTVCGIMAFVVHLSWSLVKGLQKGRDTPPYTLSSKPCGVHPS